MKNWTDYIVPIIMIILSLILLIFVVIVVASPKEREAMDVQMTITHTETYERFSRSYELDLTDENNIPYIIDVGHTTYAKYKEGDTFSATIVQYTNVFGGKSYYIIFDGEKEYLIKEYCWGGITLFNHEEG